MSGRALITQSDLTRIAKAAKASGCRAEVKIGNATITFFPDGESRPEELKGIVNGIDYSRPSL